MIPALVLVFFAVIATGPAFDEERRRLRVRRDFPAARRLPPSK